MKSNLNSNIPSRLNNSFITLKVINTNKPHPDIILETCVTYVKTYMCMQYQLVEHKGAVGLHIQQTMLIDSVHYRAFSFLHRTSSVKWLENTCFPCVRGTRSLSFTQQHASFWPVKQGPSSALLFSGSWTKTQGMFFFAPFSLELTRPDSSRSSNPQCLSTLLMTGTGAISDTATVWTCTGTTAFKSYLPCFDIKMTNTKTKEIWL